MSSVILFLGKFTPSLTICCKCSSFELKKNTFTKRSKKSQIESLLVVLLRRIVVENTSDFFFLLINLKKANIFQNN